MIVDLCLGQVDGTELTQTLVAISPGARIIDYSLRDDCVSVRRFWPQAGTAS